MKENVKEFYEKHKDGIFVTLGVLTAGAGCAYSYTLGKSKGLERGIHVGATAVELTLEEAIEEKPNLLAGEFLNEDVFKKYFNKVIES